MRNSPTLWLGILHEHHSGGLDVSVVTDDRKFFGGGIISSLVRYYKHWDCVHAISIS